MADDSLQNLLAVLHEKLQGATAIGASDRESLEQLSADLQAILAHPGTDASAKQQSIRARLAAMVTRFEGTHPDLTVTMMQVIQGLGDMGI